MALSALVLRVRSMRRVVPEMWLWAASSLVA